MRNTYQCRDICSYTQEFHKTKKLEAMIHMQRTLHNGQDSLQGDLKSTLHLEKLSPFFFSCSQHRPSFRTYLLDLCHQTSTRYAFQSLKQLSFPKLCAYLCAEFHSDLSICCPSKYKYHIWEKSALFQYIPVMYITCCEICLSCTFRLPKSHGILYPFAHFT